MKSITLIIPIYNECGALDKTLPVIIQAISGIDRFRIRILLVDDGSTDGTAEWLRDYTFTRDDVELLCLNRNFGKEAAISAGLVFAKGDAVIVMDSDLQHPPELITEMIGLWDKGIKVVEACKSSRGQESLLSKLFAAVFYGLFKFLGGMDIKNHSDFKLLDREVVEAYCKLPERKRFFRGLIPWMGFSSARIYFNVPPRKHGSSRWGNFGLFRFSLTAITGFSTAPLHIITLLGVVFIVICFVFGGIALYDKFSGIAVSGFTTVILLLLLAGGMLMIGLGMIGIYIERIYDEIKGRPQYIIDRERSVLSGRN